MFKKIPMTVRGSDILKKELKTLKSIERPKVILAISEARSYGDLKENSEYHAARERQSFIEGRIKEIENKLSNAQLIDISNLKNNGKIVFGCTVTLLNLDINKTKNYQIVGEDEADIKHDKISINSPIARALIGKDKSERILVKTPGGEINYKIVSVDYI